MKDSVLNMLSIQTCLPEEEDPMEMLNTYKIYCDGVNTMRCIYYIGKHRPMYLPFIWDQCQIRLIRLDNYGWET